MSENKNQLEREREAEDRLIDWGLRRNPREKDVATDLTDRILAAAENQKVDASTNVVAAKKSRAWSWRLAGLATVAAGLLFLLCVPAVQKSREVSRRAASLDNSRQIGLASSSRGDALSKFPTAPLPQTAPLPATDFVPVEDSTVDASTGEDDVSSLATGTSRAEDVEFELSDILLFDAENVNSPKGNVADGYVDYGGGYGDFPKSFASELDPVSRPAILEGKNRAVVYGPVVTHSDSTDGASIEDHRKRLAFFANEQEKQRLNADIPTRFAFNQANAASQGQSKTATVDWNGGKAKVVVESESRMREESYTVMIPEQKTRTESYTVMVPVKKTRKETRKRTVEGKEVEETVEVEFTENVPEQRERTVAYTVNVPEEKTRSIPYRVVIPKLFDENGKEIRLSHNKRRELLLALQQQSPEYFEPRQPPPVRENGRDRYAPIYENPFKTTKGKSAVSTFSIDVDTASYTNMRQYLKRGQMPPPDSVRLEELVNYFKYDYDGPGADAEHPFVTHTEVARCPWNEDHHLVRVAIKGREIKTDKRPLSNLVFLVDVSGSMSDPNKLPLVVDGLTQMTRKLGENDRVAIVVYAGSEGVALPSTRGDKRDKILAALQNLSAGGSTAGGAGIELAYKIAEENFIKGGTNRVLLCTDGDFNVGVTNAEALTRMAEAKAAETKVFLTVLGFGSGNLNDEMMEKISNSGNGNYHYIDSLREARRVLVEQLTGTLVTIAKDVKIQVEFNPTNVAMYRLLGYENRVMARKDFDDDTKDAGEVGAGHTVTALYEVVPTGLKKAKKVKEQAEEAPLKYQRKKETVVDEVVESPEEDSLEEAAEFSDQLFTLRLRYKQPDEDVSTKIEVEVDKSDRQFENASEDFRFASSVAGFGMLLRGSQHKGDATYSSIRGMAAESLGDDEKGYRAELIELIDAAARLGR